MNLTAHICGGQAFDNASFARTSHFFYASHTRRTHTHTIIYDTHFLIFCKIVEYLRSMYHQLCYPHRLTSFVVMTLMAFRWMPLIIMLHASFQSGGSASVPSLFYIYPLGQDYWWRWPRPDSDCRKSNYLSHDGSHLSGTGALLNSSIGYFSTWHFSLFNSVFNRLRRSNRRTRDPDKATLFIIPYDLALDGMINQECQRREYCTPGLAPKLMDLLNSSKYFQRFRGADHVLLWSVCQYNMWPGAKCNDLLKRFCERCSITSYWADPMIKNNRFFSIPFPSSYHFMNNSIIPWKIEHSELRSTFAIYVGGNQTLTPTSTKLRRALIAQCSKSPKCKWLATTRNFRDKSQVSSIPEYRRSIFCLCPTGDDPGRKAFFDIVLSGCIPVVFSPSTAYNQYTYHIGEEIAKSITIYIPSAEIRSGRINFVDLLQTVTPDVIKKKQKAIENIGFRIQYSVPPLGLLDDPTDETPWESPVTDAADILLEALFERAQFKTENINNPNATLVLPNVPPTPTDWEKRYSKLFIDDAYS